LGGDHRTPMQLKLVQGFLPSIHRSGPPSGVTHNSELRQGNVHHFNEEICIIRPRDSMYTRMLPSSVYIYRLVYYTTVCTNVPASSLVKHRGGVILKTFP
jgi:hypothetical protein